MTSSNPVYIVVQILASLTISWTGPSSYPRAFTAPSAITQGAFFNLTRSGGGTFNVSAEWPQLVLVLFAQAAASTSSFMDGFPTRPGSTYSSVSGHGNSRRMTSSNPVYIVVQILASLTISWTGPSSYPRAFTAPSAITQGAFFNLTRSGGGTFNVSAEWPQLVLVPFAQAAASTSSFMDGFPTRPGSTYSSVNGPLSSTPNEVYLNVVPRSACSHHFKDRSVEGLICATNKGRDICDGDAGGPLMQFFAGRYYAAGLASSGKAGGCAQDGVPAVFTKVGVLLKWIHTVTGLQTA
ncbi:transmembrane protease serine 9-like [Ixodes scapularis]